ncbi:MAG TPA: CBS domain-containing protein [Azospirillum sp.]|nr:CBS domain-containing protein [Azospirillum sp.]
MAQVTARTQSTEKSQQSETEPLEAAAQRVSSAARAGTQADAEALREGGQYLGRSLQEGARAAQQGIEVSAQTTRRGIEAVGQGAQNLVETSADQFQQMGDMMANAARDASDSARMLATFASFTNDGIRGMQQATSGLLERMVQINVNAMQEMLRQANVGAMTAFQQRFARDYLEAMAQGSAELLRAAQQLATEAVRPIEEHARARREAQGEREQQQGGTIGDVMSRKVRTVKPDDTVQQAAKLMSDEDTGVLPVAEDSRVIGMLTDRDIAIRLVGASRDPAKSRVRDVMSQDVLYCYEDEDIDHIAGIMADQQLHRLPVMDRRQNLVGIVSVGDLADRQSPEMAGQALAGISRSSRQHSQRAQSPRQRKRA